MLPTTAASKGRSADLPIAAVARQESTQPKRQNTLNTTIEVLERAVDFFS